MSNLQDVINRLSKIEGHIRGIKKMAEEGRNCEELLIQLSAVKSAVNNVGKVILEDYVEECVVEGFRKQSEQETVENVKKVLKKCL